MKSSVPSSFFASSINLAITKVLVQFHDSNIDLQQSRNLLNDPSTRWWNETHEVCDLICQTFENMCCKLFYVFPLFSRICQRYIAVREPHRQAYKQVVNVEYETICSDGLSCKKTRPTYRTIFRTVYRTAYKCSSDLEEK